MRKRSTEILEKLALSHSGEIEAKKIIKDYRISMKTLKQDLIEINHFLEESDLESIKLTSTGKIVLLEKRNHKLRDRIDCMDTYSYKMSREERQIYIIAALLTSNDFVTMQNLAMELNVSRNTILGDFEMVKDYFQAFQIKILMKSSKGIKIQRNQKEIYDLLLELFSNMEENMEADSFFRRMIEKKLGMQIRIREIRKHLQEYMTKENLLFSDKILIKISLYLYLFVNHRLKIPGDGQEIVTAEQQNKMEEILVWFGKVFAIPVQKEDMQNFAAYIEENHLQAAEKEIDDIELYGIIAYFLLKVGNDIGINLQTDTVLIESLLQHIKNLKNWEDFDFEMPISSEIMISEEILARSIEENSTILEKYLGYSLNMEMKKSIMVHICAAFVRNRKYLDLVTVLIACPGSMATGKYLEAQVKNYFHFHIAGVLPSREVEQFLEHNVVDFIISTVDIKTGSVPVMKVNAVMDMKDMNAIQNMAFTLGKNTYENGEASLLRLQEAFLKNICNFMEKLSVEKQKGFSTQVYELMKVFGQKGSMLSQVLDMDKILIESRAIQWEDGIKKAAKILEEDGVIGSEYAKQAIKNVREYGDYIVISKGVALAHASKECQVYKEGLSLLVCPEGIEFTQGNKVYLLFCFATQGKKDYLELFHEIISIGKNPVKLKQMIDQKDAAGIFQSLLFL
jgi:mannitol operon transcriptional antiterminator